MSHKTRSSALDNRGLLITYTAFHFALAINFAFRLRAMSSLSGPAKNMKPCAIAVDVLHGTVFVQDSRNHSQRSRREVIRIEKYRHHLLLPWRTVFLTLTRPVSATEKYCPPRKEKMMPIF